MQPGSNHTDTLTESNIETLVEQLGALRAEMGKVIVGQRAVIEELLTALVAGGHCLVEGVPGLAKTLMIRTLAEAVEAGFSRIQFTPDLMPTDIIGTEVLEEDPGTGRRAFTFTRGPIFANIILADEINRTPPKTQAALLEAMQERQVTHGGETHRLEPPFFVLATQNPIEQAGTYALPEAQLDRFLLYVTIGYPSEEEEEAVLRQTTGRAKLSAAPVMTAEAVMQAQALAREVEISAPLVGYANRLVRATRPQTSTRAYVQQWVRWGAGPRAGQALILTAKARALLQGRFAVTLGDLRRMAAPALRHRVLMHFKAEAEGVTADDVTEHLLEEVAAPESPLF